VYTDQKMSCFRCCSSVGSCSIEERRLYPKVWHM
jgi:hypothetical protein